MSITSKKALESRARRAAKRAGYIAMKSRRLRGTKDNFGGFTIIEPRSNTIVAGVRLDLTAQAVINWCEKR